ncbi:class I SAM-dependent methyltransferase [Corynebacterium timonense]|uniref:Cyclopropane-fatty-acyl-phospholipid synthase n=2 Tax=Corynebacterium timonense TaxID=441500 RepID=A0A1H1P9N5_9CORY|nr:class I SAM-dependent methyltransferase [Corynebacterium timonense]SDS07971.1 cyclopropane-fatty-acyl-phospholipid synthase [Corynebacterium timonense]
MPQSHLESIDAEAWPGVATVPAGRATRLRARHAEAVFARACAKAGIELDPAAGAKIVVARPEVFARIADSGWVGLAEGFMAGEWSATSTDALVDALESLIRGGYRPKARPAVQAGSHAAASGDVPPELVQLYAGDGMSGFAGHFATGVPTKERVAVTSHVPGAGRGGAPATHFVDVTTIGAPLDAERGDLAHAQARSVEMLLEAARVGSGTHLAEYPASGGAIAIEAARRGATVDSFAADAAAAGAIRERVTFAGVSGSAIRVAQEGQQRRGSYDAAVSVERLEALAPREKAGYLAGLGALIHPGGRIALQTIMRTPTYSASADAALDSLRAYVWAGLSFATPDELATLVDRRTELRIIAQSHAPEHVAHSLRLQRQTFDAHLREAAADGFDAVYRRLWQWQFALREALARAGMLDLVHVTLVPRTRRGRR